MISVVIDEILSICYLPENLDINFSISQDDAQKIYISKTKCILFSFKNTKNINLIGLEQAVRFLEFLGKKTQKQIGFCEYDKDVFNFILKNRKILNFSLFQSEKIARLFFENLAKRVAVLEPKKELRDEIFLTLSSRQKCVYAPKNPKNFDKNIENFSDTITPLTILNTQKFDEIYERDTAVIYSVKGLMDSDFVASFSYKHYTALIHAGFRFFAFDVECSGAFGLSAAKFLSKISSIGREYGVLISVCGVKKLNISAKIYKILTDLHIFFYPSLDAFLNDDSVVYVDEKVDFSPKHITKQLGPFVPKIIKESVNSLDFVFNKEVFYEQIKVSNYEINQDLEFSSGVLSFYGDIDFRLVLSLDKALLDELSKGFFDDESEHRLSLYGLLNIISSKITALFASKNLNLEVAMPKFYLGENYFDTTSVGALVDFFIDEKAGAIFVSS